MTRVLTKQFTSLELDVAAGTTSIFTLGDGTIINGRVQLHNTSGGAVTVIGYIVPNAGSKVAKNKFYEASLASLSTSMIDIPKMVATDTLHLYASAANSVTALDHDLVPIS